MTTSRLPEITVTCRKRHVFRTRAHGGQGVDCPQCRTDGQRVKVWVRKDRPRTARELADQETADAPAASVRPDAELAARWAREAPWDGQIRPVPGRAGDACPECSGPAQWEPGRTMTYCPECSRVGLPAAVTGHYARQAQRSAEVAVRSAEIAARDVPDPAVERAARVRLRALGQRMTDHVGEWIDTFDPDGLSGNAERLALDYQAELAAYLPEIRHAKSEHELAEIAAEITEVTSRAASTGAMATVAQERDAQERDAQWREREQQEAEEAEEDERERQRQAALAARAATVAVKPRKTDWPTVPKSSSAQAMASVAVMVAERNARVERNGHCAFPHTFMKVPATHQVVGSMSYHQQMNEASTAVQCCYKHLTDAIAYIGNLGWPYYRAEDISREGQPRVIVQ